MRWIVPSELSPPTPSITSIACHSKLGSGQIGHVYLGTGNDNSRYAVKIVFGVRNREALYQEWNNYGLLLPLGVQGKYVPRCYGLLQCGDEEIDSGFSALLLQVIGDGQPILHDGKFDKVPLADRQVATVSMHSLFSVLIYQTGKRYTTSYARFTKPSSGFLMFTQRTLFERGAEGLSSLTWSIWRHTTDVLGRKDSVAIYRG